MVSLKGPISRLHEQPCRLHALIAQQEHSPIPKRINPSENWFILRSYEDWYFHLDIRGWLKIMGSNPGSVSSQRLMSRWKYQF